FTGNAPYLCVGGGFVAMAGIHRNADLIVMPIDVNGINAPQPIAQFDAINGMRCGAHHIELLALDYKSGHTNKFLYTVQWHSQSPSTVHEDQKEDISVLRIGPEPPAMDFLNWGGNTAGGYRRGDWYEWVPQVVDRPNNTYEVHFVSTHEKNCGKLVVTLLEETRDKKVTRSVPLVHIEGCSDSRLTHARPTVLGLRNIAITPTENLVPTLDDAGGPGEVVGGAALRWRSQRTA